MELSNIHRTIYLREGSKEDSMIGKSGSMSVVNGFTVVNGKLNFTVKLKDPI